MPGATSEGPTVALSFANNFWGKDDAGVEPLLQRMHNAKLTCDELKTFYASRATIEDEYARKLLSLSRKSLGSQETGTLRASLDVLRGEIEQMGKSHQNIASQMKTELEEPLAAFAGAMKERRKIVQSGIEKLLKAKIQQTNQVNKTRDRYEQECLKIKGYLAQGHMVMGQEERRNKAKLEKTQIHLAASNTEYENAVKALEDTTGRWNRDWKAAADKFQDLEEERLDFTKSSLWSFANIASTVCVSDDASCEKVRLSLEKCEVEKDIATFIKECGTGQEIPDPPKYINFCRGDASDSQSEMSDDDHYSVAQFPRTINPAYRSSSPQPSTYESHHDSPIDLSRESMTPRSRESTMTPQKARASIPRNAHIEDHPESRKSSLLMDKETHLPRDQHQIENNAQGMRQSPRNHQQTQHNVPAMRKSPREQQQRAQNGPQYMRQSPHEHQTSQNNQRPEFDHQARTTTSQNHQQSPNQQHEAHNVVPHDPYPMDGMTMLCRTGGTSSDRSPALSSEARSSNRDSQSDLTPISSHEPPNDKISPIKQNVSLTARQDTKKKGGFFQNHGPFRRRSNKQKNETRIMTPSNRNTWSARSTNKEFPTNTPHYQNPSQQNLASNRISPSPEPFDPRSSFQLNVGNNIFDVDTPESKEKTNHKTGPQPENELDPIAQALAELKGVTKASTTRVSADNYHGIATPAPGATPQSRPTGPQIPNGALIAGLRGTPPPSYDLPAQRLGLPQPAFTSKAMQQTKQKYVSQTQNMFKPQARAGSRAGYDPNVPSRTGGRGKEIPRALSPAPSRGTSPRPRMQADPRSMYRPSSPNPFVKSQHANSQSMVLQRPRGMDQGYYTQGSPTETRTNLSGLEKQPSHQSSKETSMQMQLASVGNENYGSPRGRNNRPNGTNNHYPSRGNQQPTPDDGYHQQSGRNSRASGNVSPRPMSQYGNRGNQLSNGEDCYGPPSGRNSSASGNLSPRPMSQYGNRGNQQLGSVEDNYGFPNGRNSRASGTVSPMSVSQYENRGNQQLATRPRSKSVADIRQYNSQGRPILHFARALYMYQAAIPEELGFAKGDVLAVLRHQDDGWWEAEVAGKNERTGLVPSNYLQIC